MAPTCLLRGSHSKVYKEISCAPHLTQIKKTPIKKGFRKIRKIKSFSLTRKYLLNQGTDVSPTLL